MTKRELQADRDRWRERALESERRLGQHMTRINDVNRILVAARRFVASLGPLVARSDDDALKLGYQIEAQHYLAVCEENATPPPASVAR